ncbi:antibiotic resistance protein [Phyllobacterium sp. BT25]|uniref:Antibiotic resistance protein n=1 Tax=Phyllobacterium pellucidum TaxID=2740464 RepID=A0A849VL91_9HYPH|nr:TfuA-like protein [Phyllobacterium pellucidum]NTS30571.1 antibiotic resistance protein [Phyllobacterium pellucidum]
MQVLFAGPSLSGTKFVPLKSGEDRVLPEYGLTCRGPAKCGDITHAVDQGFDVIALVDGRFEDVAAVWHKEILHALSAGATVYGAASMGALRAAECHPFGMIGIGHVFERYAHGGLEDDAAVAQVHAPAEFGYLAFSEAMVTVDATLDAALAAGSIRPDEHELIRARADAVFFKERSWRRIFDAVAADIENPADRLKPHMRNIKREDAEALLGILLEGKPSAPGDVSPEFAGWRFNATTQWRKLRG